MRWPRLAGAPGLLSGQGSRVVLAGVGCGLVAFAAGTPYWCEHLFAAAVTVLVCFLYGCAGALLATGGEHQRRTGQLLLVGAICWPCVWLLAWNGGVGPLISAYAEALFYVAVGAAILSYPAGRLTGRSERWWVVAGFMVFVIGQLWSELVSTPEWNGLPHDAFWPNFAGSRGQFDLSINVNIWTQLAVALWFVVLLWRRGRRLTGLDRHLALPVLAAGGIGGLLATALSSSTEQWTESGPLLQYYSYAGPIGLLIPMAVLIGALRERWQELSAPSRVVRQTATRITVASVQSALAAGLRDPSLLLLFWVPTENYYVDQDGGQHGADEHAPAARWRIKAQTDDEQPLAIIEVDASFQRRRQLVEAVLRAGSQPLLTAQLEAAATHHLKQMLAAQARVEEKELAERRRLERDLHEGAQRQLDRLAGQLEALSRTTSDGTARSVAAACHAEALATIAELQTLVSGLQPPVLREDGLKPALDEVVGRLGLAVELAVSDERHPPAVEATAYFAFCEALTNVAKYAPDAAVRIEVTTANGWLHGLVADNGPGGARQVPGGGLAGIEDRAKALHGWTRLESTEGSGTQLRVALPCA
jgi:signal transduction histidine kinase